MIKQILKIALIFLLLIGFTSTALAQVEVMQKRVDKRVDRERAEFKQLIIQNPNYFGTFPEYEFKPVKLIKFNTKYEVLKCFGFYPEQDLLEAIVDVKLPYGYMGNLCTSGSYEYVRFFADWNGDGDFEDSKEDLGISAVNVHDIPNTKQACLTTFKPLSYALPLNLDSLKLKFCIMPNMVKVRAILSWEIQPTAGNPNFIPVWGNVVDKWIQIRLRKIYMVDVLNFDKIKEFQIDTSLIKLNLPISKPKPLPVEKLKKIYKGKDVPDLRYNFSKVYRKALTIKQNPILMAQYKLDPKNKKLLENIKIVLTEKSNTRYEQLYCVGLNYNQDQLVATLTVKLPYGYCGNLCTSGSNEYIAFWAYVYDQIEQQCIWRYLGTSSVNVHDIKSIPPGGLQYAVYLPADFSDYRDKCNKPKVIKVRAILSWNSKPPENDPYYNPVWGNKVDALIQIKPGPSIQPGEQLPYIWALGEMAVESIFGNPFTVETSSLGDGYANGVSIGGGYTAIESPFGGVVKISGSISNAPDISESASKLRYKVQYREITEASWHDIGNKFKIWIRENSVPSGYLWQVKDSEGYFSYQKDLKGPNIIEVQDDVIAQWYSPSVEEDGLYEIRMLLHKTGATPQPGVPADHISSDIIKIMIDNTRPEAQISLDAGPCTKFTVGDIITGKFTATDDHIWHYNLSVEPTVSVSPTISPSQEIYPALIVPGKTDETYTLTTTATTTPCGYVIRLRVWDRTIRNNHMIGNYRPATVGLCILEEE